ncbi:MAG: hypothetical protein ABFD02_13805, partial [Bacteroidales bacterium]
LLSAIRFRSLRLFRDLKDCSFSPIQSTTCPAHFIYGSFRASQGKMLPFQRVYYNHTCLINKFTSIPPGAGTNEEPERSSMKSK